MKKTVRVQIEKEYEIDIDESILTPEFVKEFEAMMWELDGDTLEQKYEALFKVAAHQLANDETEFVEGLGRASSVFSVDFKRKAGAHIIVVYENLYEDTEVEVVE
jgi:hypothetical protein